MGLVARCRALDPSDTYDAYRYSGDLELLKNDIYPALREEAQLYSKTLIKDENGKYISSPAYSPEQGPRTATNTYDAGARVAALPRCHRGRQAGGRG